MLKGVSFIGVIDLMQKGLGEEVGGWLRVPTVLFFNLIIGILGSGMALIMDPFVPHIFGLHIYSIPLIMTA